MTTVVRFSQYGSVAIQPKIMLRYVWLWFLLVSSRTSGQHPGLPPWQPKPVHGVCNPGWYLHHTFYNLTCAPCPLGAFSPGNYSKCMACPAGYTSTKMGSSSCNLCAVNYYAADKQRRCISCSDPTYNLWASGSGVGWVTFGAGSTSINQCFDLDLAVFFGWTWLLFVTVFTTFMICDGYIHKISFFRNLRVTQACARILNTLRRDVDRILKDPRWQNDDTDDEQEEEERKHEDDEGFELESDDEVAAAAALAEERRQKELNAARKKREEKLLRKQRKGVVQRVLENIMYRIGATGRAILFVTLGLGFILFVTMLIFIYQLTHVFFQGILMYRVLGNKSDVSSFIAFMNSWTAGVSFVLPFTGVLLTGPITIFLQFLLTLQLELDFSMVNINCTGAQAPFELLFCSCLFCMIIVVIQSDACALFSPLKTAVMDKYLHLLHATGKQRRHYGVRFVLLIGIMIIGPMSNPAIPFLQYLLTIMTMNKFFEYSGRHLSNPVCDAPTTSSVVYNDIVLATLTSLWTYLLIIPLLWTAAKALYPSACPAPIRKRLSLYKREIWPRCCWHDDGIDTHEVDPVTKHFRSRTLIQYIYNRVSIVFLVCGLLFFMGFAYIDAFLYVLFYCWAWSVSKHKTVISTSVSHASNTLLQIFHAIRMPSRSHSDWKIVDPLIAQQLPSFINYCRLWICTRQRRKLKGRRFFAKPRSGDPPDLNWLAFNDVLRKFYRFLVIGLGGWWDLKAVHEMSVPAMVSQLMLDEVLEEYPHEYFRDLLASVIVPRATLLRFIPQLTPVAFWIQQMATSPTRIPSWPLPDHLCDENDLYSMNRSSLDHLKSSLSGFTGSLSATATPTPTTKPIPSAMLSPSRVWSTTRNLLRLNNHTPSTVLTMGSPDALPTSTIPVDAPSSPDGQPTVDNNVSPGTPNTPGYSPNKSLLHAVSEADAVVAAQERQARNEKRAARKRKRNHHLRLAWLEAQLKGETVKQAELHVLQWPLYLAAPHKFLHSRPLLPTWLFVPKGTVDNATIGPTWLWCVNFGHFVLAMWLAFSGSVGSAANVPGLLGVLVFFTYAAILPFAFAVSLRALIPIGHFFGVHDDDFLPFKGIFTICKKRAAKPDPPISHTTTAGILDRQDSVVVSSVQPGLGGVSAKETNGGENQPELVSSPSSRLLFPSSLSPKNEGYLDVEHGGVEIGEPSLGQMSLHGSVSLFTGSLFEDDSHVHMFVDKELEGDMERGHEGDLEGKGFVGAQSQEITVGMTEMESFGK